MKKLFCYFLFVALIIPVTTIQSQNQTEKCGTMEYLNWLIQQYPELEQILANMELETERELQRDPDYLSSETVTVIPAVVHVIWNNSAQNISDAMIESQIEVLNEDFRRMEGTNGWNTDPVGDDTKYEWRLATVDPNGNPTNGITRTQTSVSSFPYGNSMKYTSSGGHDAWPSQNYLNIWVCNLSSGLLGFATFPGGNPALDGVVILYSAFGRNSPFYPYHMGRTTTHEIGHWIWLYHTFQNGCSPPGDYCDDTPYISGSTFGCPIGSSSCSTPNMVENYMDYSDDLCMNIFTIDQDDRFDVAINTWRSDLLVSYRETIPVPTTGTDYNFTDVNGNTFATLNFSSLGTVDTVTVEVWPNYYPVNQPAGTKAVKRFFDISAHGGTGFNATLTVHYDDAEVIGFTNNDDFLELYKYSGSYWMQMGGTVNTTANTVTLAGVSEMSIWALSDPNDSPVPVELISFTSVVDENNVNLNWITATETNNFGFEIERSLSGSRYEQIGFVESHGTTTEAQVYTFTDNNLKPGNYYYRLKVVDNDGSFEYSKAVNVLVEAPAKFSLSQNYPNPFNPLTQIYYQIPETGLVKLKVYDLLGNEVATLVDGIVEAGIHEVSFNASKLTSSVYFYTIKAGTFVQTKKMILMK